MGIFVAFLIGSMTFLIASGSESMCCKKKVVGGVAYTLIEVDHEASDFSCKNDCIYTTIDGGRYCFRVGDMESTCVPEEEILFMGGSNEIAEFRNTVGVYPGNPCHYSTDPIPHDLYDAAAAYRGNTILMCGGNTTGLISKDCYIIKKDGTRPEGPSMIASRNAFTMNTVGANLLVTGGYGGTWRNALNTVEILKPEATGWTDAGYTLNPPRAFHCGLTVSTTSVMLIGGWRVGGKLKTTEEIDIITGVPTAYDDLPVALSGHACAHYRKEIWISGGKTDVFLNTVYSLDHSQTTNKWIPRPSLENAREKHAMFVIDDILTVYSGDGPGKFYVESFVDGAWEPRSLSSSRWSTAYVKLQCSRC